MAQQTDWGEFLRNNLQTGLLVIAAFVIGYLFSQVQTQSMDAGNKPSNNNVEQAGNNLEEAPQVTLTSILKEVGVNAQDVMNCVDSGEYTAQVEADQAAAQKAGVTGTPGNFIVLGNGQGEAIKGALPYAQLQPVIDSYLNEGGTDNTAAIPNLPPVDENDHIRGDENAQVTIIEYSDYDCPFCSRFHETMKQVVDEYDGQVRWVYRHFPLPQLHPNATAVAEASECVAAQEGEDAYWAFSDKYFATKGSGAQISIE